MYHTGYHFNMSMNLEIRQQQSCVLFTLGTRREFGIFARSVRIELLLSCYTASLPETRSPARRRRRLRYTPLPSHVPYANRTFEHRRTYTKRLTVEVRGMKPRDVRVI